MNLTLQALGDTTERRPCQPKIRSVTELFDVGKSSVHTIREFTKSVAVVA